MCNLNQEIDPLIISAHSRYLDQAIRIKSIQHKGLGLRVFNTKDRDEEYPTQRIGIKSIQHKGSG